MGRADRRSLLVSKRSMKAYLVARQGEMRGEFWALEPGQKLTLGRSPDNRIVLRDDLASRNHAEVFPQADGWGIRDLGSRNGTRVNGQLISRPTRLAWNDVILVGGSEFLLADNPPDSAPGDGVTLGDLEKEPVEPRKKPGLAITVRLSRSRLLTQSESQLLAQPRVHHDMVRLYKLALAMGS